MNTDLISYDNNGSINRGLYHRAVMVARELLKAGRWDGQTHIVIVNPDDLCRQMDLLNRQASDLQQGVDYLLQ